MEKQKVLIVGNIPTGTMLQQISDAGYEIVGSADTVTEAVKEELKQKENPFLNDNVLSLVNPYTALSEMRSVYMGEGTSKNDLKKCKKGIHAWKHVDTDKKKCIHCKKEI